MGLVRLSFPQGLACTLHSRTNLNLHRTPCGEDGEGRGCVDRKLSAEDCCRRCTMVNDLGSSASCELLNKRMCLQETICQRANSARQRPPLRSTKMLPASACVLQLSLMLRRCKNVRRTQCVDCVFTMFCAVLLRPFIHAGKIVLKSFSHIHPKSAFVHDQSFHRAKKRANDMFLQLTYLMCFPLCGCIVMQSNLWIVAIFFSRKDY